VDLTRTILTLCAIGCATSAPSVAEDEPDVPAPRAAAPLREDNGATGLASVTEAAGRAVDAIQASRAKRVAILEVRSLDGGRTMLGRFLAEEITTATQRAGGVTVVERRLIDEMMSEGKFAETGLLDDRTAAEIGGKLGADAVLAGTLTEFGDSLRFNLRVIQAKSGQVAAAEQATLVLDAPLKKLWNGTTPDGAGPSGRGGSTSSRAAMVGAVFAEDFSTVPEGQLPAGWIGPDQLGVASSGRERYLTSLKRSAGDGPYGIYKILVPNVPFPTDFELELLYEARRGIKFHVGKVSVNLGCCTSYEGDDAELTNATSLGNGVNSSGVFQKARLVAVLQKRGPVLRLLVDGAQVLMSRMSDLDPADTLVFESADFKLYRVAVHKLGP
jgi:TolB-like protein